MDPPVRIRAIHCYQHRPLIFFIIRPYAVNRFFMNIFSVDQATGIGFIIRIIFDYFSIKNAEKYFFKAEIIRIGFFIRMISNSNPISADRYDDIIDFHSIMSGRWDLNPRPCGPKPHALARLRYAPNIYYGTQLLQFFATAAGLQIEFSLHGRLSRCEARCVYDTPRYAIPSGLRVS